MSLHTLNKRYTVLQNGITEFRAKSSSTRSQVREMSGPGNKRRKSSALLALFNADGAFCFKLEKLRMLNEWKQRARS